MADKAPVIGLLTVRKAWIDNTGFGQIFRPTNPQSNAELYILPVAKFSVGHSHFVEIEWYPRVLEGKPARLFIPNHEVISIVIVGSEAADKLDNIGFKV